MNWSDLLVTFQIEVNLPHPGFHIAQDAVWKFSHSRRMVPPKKSRETPGAAQETGWGEGTGAPWGSDHDLV